MYSNLGCANCKGNCKSCPSGDDGVGFVTTAAILAAKYGPKMKRLFRGKRPSACPIETDFVSHGYQKTFRRHVANLKNPTPEVRAKFGSIPAGAHITDDDLRDVFQYWIANCMELEDGKVCPGPRKCSSSQMRSVALKSDDLIAAMLSDKFGTYGLTHPAPKLPGQPAPPALPGGRTAPPPVTSLPSVFNPPARGAGIQRPTTAGFGGAAAIALGLAALMFSRKAR